MDVTITIDENDVLAAVAPQYPSRRLPDAAGVPGPATLMSMPAIAVKLVFG